MTSTPTARGRAGRARRSWLSRSTASTGSAATRHWTRRETSGISGHIAQQPRAHEPSSFGCGILYSLRMASTASGNSLLEAGRNLAPLIREHAGYGDEHGVLAP